MPFSKEPICAKPTSVSATEWSIDPSDNRLRGARFDATDLSGLVKGLGIRLD